MPSRTLWISIRTNWIQRSTQKNAGGGERRAELRRSARRQQFIIKVSSWRFYNRQEEVLNQKSPKVIDRFVFNYLAVDNAGQTADNKHTGSMIFPFFLLASKTDKPLGDDTFQNQSVKLICWQAFSFTWFFSCFFLFSFFREISSHFTNDIRLVTQMAWCWFQPVGKRYQVEDWHLINSDQSLFLWAWKMEKTMASLQAFLSFLPRAPKFPLPLPLLTPAT